MPSSGQRTRVGHNHPVAPDDGSHRSRPHPRCMLLLLLLLFFSSRRQRPVGRTAATLLLVLRRTPRCPGLRRAKAPVLWVQGGQHAGAHQVALQKVLAAAQLLHRLLRLGLKSVAVAANPRAVSAAAAGLEWHAAAAAGRRAAGFCSAG